METKICVECKEEKELSLFKKAPTYNKGVFSKCRICDAKNRREFRANNIELCRERARKEYHNNKEKRNASANLWKEKNKARLVEWGKNYRDSNRERYNNLAQKNREKHRDSYNLRAREKRKNCSIERLKGRIRNNIYKSIVKKNFCKNGSTEKILGCNYEFFIQYIEAQFAKGMNWGNIHIDHIKPMAVCKTEQDVYDLNHYTNLQPLFIKDNLSKNAKLITKQLRLI